MHKLLTVLFLLILAATASFADDWTQTHWETETEGTTPQPYTDGEFFASSGVAIHRIWYNSTDNAILLDGPDWTRNFKTITTLPSTVGEIFCGTIIGSVNRSNIVLGGKTTTDHPAIWYSIDGGVTWNENSNTGIDGSVMALSPDAAGSNLLVFSFKENTPRRIIVHRLSSFSETWGSDEYSGLAVGDIVSSASFFVTDNDSELFSYADQGTDGGAVFRHSSSVWNRIGATGGLPVNNTDYYELWETGQSSARLFTGVNSNGGDDNPYYTGDASGAGGWQQWNADYMTGTNYVCFAAHADGGDYIFLGANSTDLARVNYNSPGTSHLISDTNLATIYDLAVSDHSRPWVSYSDGTDCWLKPCLDDEGTTWANPVRLANFDTAPVVLQDVFGLGYFAGTNGSTGILNMSYPIETGWLESSVYDCGGLSTFDSISVNYDIEEGSSAIKLRSSPEPSMAGADGWTDCDYVTDFDDLSSVKGLYNGDRYVQYLIVFNLPDSLNPWQQNVIDSFTLNYHEFEEDPRIVSTVPKNNDTDVSTNVNVVIFFNKPVDPSTLNSQTVVVKDDGDTIDWQGTYNAGDDAFRIDPNDDFDSHSPITVVLQGNIRDTNGTLLGDQNGTAPGLYNFRFTTGGSADDEAPYIIKAEVTPNPTFGQAKITLTGQVSDEDTGGSDITYAEYFVDNLGDNWDGIAIAASDGSFDSSTEDLLAQVDASGWSLGSTHQIYVHVADSADNFSQYKVINVETEGGFLDEQSVYAWPNPVTGGTAHFKCTLGGDGNVELFVYDLAGRQVHHDTATATSGTAVEFEWNLSGVGSDVYLYRIYATEASGSRSAQSGGSRSGVVVKKIVIVN